MERLLALVVTVLAAPHVLASSPRWLLGATCALAVAGALWIAFR